MNKLWLWLDNRIDNYLTNIIKIGVLFLVLFIPLYPKLPLIDVTGTWVYIRLEDILIAGLVFLFGLKLWREKGISLGTPLTIPIALFWIVGLVSVIFSLVVIGPKLEGYFPHLVMLHYLRRFEYIILFFVAAATIRSIRDVYLYITVFAVTVFLVSLYGLGQKFMGLPAFLTMNEEFAKGVPLFLSEASRITSTFAGHYDLAAFLVFAIVFLGSVIFGVKNIIGRLVLMLLCLLAYFVLLLTASRISFGVYLVAVAVMLWWNKRRLMIIPVIIVSILLLQNVGSASSRFGKTFRLRQVLYDVNSGRPVAIVTVGDRGQLIAEKPKTAAEEDLPIGSGYINVPIAPAAAVTQPAATALPPEEELRLALEKKQLFTYQGIRLATGAGEIATVSGSFILQNALVYDISLTTRFQGQWPRAWRAFERNYLLGSGYSTLSLAADSDYLRLLGETGLLGFLSFIYVFVVYFLFVRSAIARAPPIAQSMAVGSMAGLVGLSLNAVLIDVFEASKVAYPLWLSLGAVVGGLRLTYRESFPVFRETRRMLAHPATFIIFLLVLAFVWYGRATGFYFVADDFTWLRWAATSYTSDFPKYFTDAAGFFYRPLTKIYFFFGFALFWLKPIGYHTVNILLHFGSTALVYLLARKTTGSAKVSILASLYFLILAIHHENVIWISGISSLFGGFLSLLALYSFSLSMSDGRSRWFHLLGSVVVMAAATLFYEGMLFMPLTIVLWAFLFGDRRSRAVSLVFLLLIPAYWVLRTNAHALTPSGSYGINVRALPFNVGGNLFGYLMLTFLGPMSIEIYTSIREFFKLFPVVGSGVILSVSIFILGIWRKFPQIFRLGRTPVFWLIFTVIALAPYLPLGNIAERYGYVATAGISILLVEATLFLYGRCSGYLGRWGALAVILFFAGSVYANMQQLTKISRDWQEAGKTSAKILLSIRKVFFPVAPGTSFIYANVPTRIGRAWVFPVGLKDAHFHIFRDDSIIVEVVGTPEEALAVKEKNPAYSKALLIEGDDVKEIYK